MYSNESLVNFVKSKLKINSAYMWGEYGRKITKSTISQKAKQYPSYYSASRQKTLNELVNKNYYGCDCVGLYKWFLWTKGGTSTKITYDSKTDRNTSGMYSAASEIGDINSMPEIPGIILYMTGHVGIYIGNNEVIECTLSSFGDGIIKTNKNDRKWSSWLKMPEIDYSTKTNNEEKKSITEIAKDVINGDYGNGEARKQALTAAGYNYTEVQNEVNRLLYGNKEEVNEGLIDMVVTPSVGLWLNNSDTRWNTSTHIVCMPKNSRVQMYSGSEKALGQYTCVKVIYGTTTGYCAKEYLATV